MKPMSETAITETRAPENGLLTEIAEMGVLYGHKKSKTHPKMKPYVGANRNEIELIKPEAVISSLEKTTAFLAEQIRKGRQVLVAATTPASEAATKEFTEEFKLPCVSERWLGGTLTNFKAIRERIKCYLDLKEKKTKGELEKYTKKERVQFDKELAKLTRKFERIANLVSLPAVLLVIDGTKHMTAIREAKRVHISVVGVIDTDDDPTLFDHIIIANDHAKNSIKWIMDCLTAGIKQCIKECKTTEEKPGSEKAMEEKNGDEEKIA